MARAHFVDLALQIVKAACVPAVAMMVLTAAPARADVTLIDFSDQTASFSAPVSNPLVYPNLTFSSDAGMRVFTFTGAGLDKGLCPHLTNACRSQLIIDIATSISELRFDVFQVDLPGSSLTVTTRSAIGSETRIIPLSLGFAVNSITLSSLTGVTQLVLDGRADEEGVIYDNFRFETPGAVATGVPEPMTWGLMVVGFGLLGGAMRARPRTA